MAECVPRLGLGGVAEEAGDVGKALDVGHPREVQIAAVGLRLARERVLQIRETLAALEAWTCHGFLLGMGAPSEGSPLPLLGVVGPAA